MVPSIYTSLTLFAGGCLQGIVGFGLGLFCVPLLLNVGLIRVRGAGPRIHKSTAIQTVNGAHHLRHAIPWRVMGFSLLIRAAAMILGIALLRILTDYSIPSLKFWVGVVMLALVATQAWGIRTLAPTFMRPGIGSPFLQAVSREGFVP